MNIVWGVVIVAVLIVVGILAFKKPTGTPVTTDNSITTTSTDNSTTTEPESVQDTSGQTTGVAPISISYANALVKYADRRIQINTACQVPLPNSVTYKDNTGIMIDNRSPETHTVKVGTTFTMKPYSFRIVILPDIYLKSKTLLVDCDKSQNVATILVQE